MFELFYPGRSIAFDSPLDVNELTRRLGQAFDGTVADGRFRLMRRVRGRNSFRSVVEGQLLPGSGGSRLNVRLRLHPLILAFGAVFALIAGTVAALASPDIPVVGGSPLLVRVLAMAAVAFVFALLGSIEARTSTRLLASVTEANPANRSPLEKPVANSARCLMLALVFSSALALPARADQVASPAGGASGECPLRAADLAKLTPYRWQVAQYQADRVFIPNGTIRIDFCELTGKDDNGQMRTGVGSSRRGRASRSSRRTRLLRGRRFSRSFWRRLRTESVQPASEAVDGQLRASGAACATRWPAGRRGRLRASSLRRRRGRRT